MSDRKLGSYTTTEEEELIEHTVLAFQKIIFTTSTKFIITLLRECLCAIDLKWNEDGLSAKVLLANVVSGWNFGIVFTSQNLIRKWQPVCDGGQVP